MTNEAGFSVGEEFEVGSLEDQTGQETIDAQRNVIFDIKKIELDKYEVDGSVKLRKVKPMLAVSAEGIDGEGKYKNKHFFPSLIAWVDTSDEKYSSDWWKKQARFPFKQFLQALGYDPKNPPKMNDEFCSENAGKQVVADILLQDDTRKATDEELASGSKKYVPTDNKKNVVTNFKKA